MSVDAATIRALPFHAPRLHTPIDVEAVLRGVPAGATCKGMYPADALVILKRAVPSRDAAELAGIPARRYVPFLDYPFTDYVRAVLAAARHAHPHRPLGVGVHEVGRQAYRAFAESQIGRVLFGALGKDFDRIVELGARGWQLSGNIGDVKHVALGPRHAAYVFRDYPILLETLQTGVAVGALDAAKLRGEVRVHLDGPGNGVIELRWE